MRTELALAYLARRAVKEHAPEVAYVRLSATSSAVPFTLAGLGLPIVTELNGRLLDELRLLGRSATAVRTVALAQRAVARVARAVVAVEDKIGRHAREALGYRDVRVIENGADIDRATPGDRDAARERLGLPPDATLFAFAGTLVPELRLDLLLEAMAHLPEAQLVIAGDGPARSRLESLAHSLVGRVRWLGARPHHEAIDLLRAADVCVNVRDGDMGMKALEYAAVGRRFVAFRVEGAERLESLFPHQQVAFLVQERSGRALAEALRSALAADRAEAIPSSALEQARASVSWDRTAARIESVLEEALEEGARRDAS